MDESQFGNEQVPLQTLYRPLSLKEAYLSATTARGQLPDPNKLAALPDSPPSTNDIISREGIIVQEQQSGKFFRTRRRGNPYKIFASYVVATLVGSPQAEVRLELLNAEPIIFEEFFFGARECKIDDINKLSQQEINALIAHFLLTEDLDFQLRNLIVTSDGKIMRIDSKLVFQDASDDYLTRDVQSEESRQQIIYERLMSDKGLQEIIRRSNVDEVIKLIEQFDLEKFRVKLVERGVSEQVINNLMNKIRYNKTKARERIELYKKNIEETISPSFHTSPSQSG